MKTLTWKVDKTVPDACPDYIPNEYTGEYPSFHCAVYHCKTITENKNKEFDLEEEAIDFANKAPSSCYDFKIDGKQVKDTREKPQYSNITYSGNLIGGNFTDNTMTNPAQGSRI